MYADQFLANLRWGLAPLAERTNASAPTWELLQPRSGAIR